MELNVMKKGNINKNKDDKILDMVRLLDEEMDIKFTRSLLKGYVHIDIYDHVSKYKQSFYLNDPTFREVRNKITKTEKLFREKRKELEGKRGIDIYDYGKYLVGLTEEEIRIYLKIKAGLSKRASGNALLKKFWKIAGANTCGMIEENSEQVTLMYRHDVERFTNKLLHKVETYWD